MRKLILGHRLLAAGIVLAVGSVIAVVILGFVYYDEPDYWLVGIPGFGTAVGTIGLAGATFRLIQRETADRDNTLTALRHSQTMAAEAARQRRDARARLIRISAWNAIRAFSNSNLDNEDLIENGTTFDMPGDANKSIFVNQVVRIEAADERPMSLHLNGLFVNGQLHRGMEPVRLPWNRLAGRESLARFTVARTVAEWVAIAEAREGGDPGDEQHAWIGVDDGFDDGVSDSYEMLLGGCPLRRSTTLTGQWILDIETDRAGYKRVGFDVRPMVRLYFLSKIGNQQLPE